VLKWGWGAPLQGADPAPGVLQCVAVILEQCVVCVMQCAAVGLKQCVEIGPFTHVIASRTYE